MEAVPVQLQGELFLLMSKLNTSTRHLLEQDSFTTKPEDPKESYVETIPVCIIPQGYNIEDVDPDLPMDGQLKF